MSHRPTHPPTHPPPTHPPPLQLVEHIDGPCVLAMTRYYTEAFAQAAAQMYGDRAKPLDILDVGASW